MRNLLKEELGFHCHHEDCDEQAAALIYVTDPLDGEMVPLYVCEEHK